MAKIYVGNNYVGDTPKTLRVPFGSHQISVQKSDFFTQKQTISIQDTLNQNLNFELKNRIIFFDDFNKVNEGWEVKIRQHSLTVCFDYDTWTSERLYKVDNSELHLTGEASMVYQNQTFTNCEIETRIRFTATENRNFGGVFFNLAANDFCKYYRIAFHNSNELNYYFGKTINAYKLQSLKDGYIKLLDGNKKSFKLNVVSANRLIRIYINDQMIIDAKDNDYSDGKIALVNMGDSEICFDYLKVLSYDPEAISFK